MNVNLAFTPQTHFAYQQGFGSAGTEWLNPIEIFVPKDLVRRVVYLDFYTDAAASDWHLEGNLTFYLNKQVMGQVPLRWGNGGVARDQTFFAPATNVDSVRIYLGTTPQQRNISPQIFTCSCDTVVWSATARILSANQPTWFLGVKSMSHW